MPNKTSVLILCVLMIGFVSYGDANEAAQQVDLTRPNVDPVMKAEPNMVRLFIVGDSTVKNCRSNRDGWGDYMSPYFNQDRIEVLNWARSGRSSRSFIGEGRWAKVLAQMKAGDFVMAQFGHNDQKPIASDRGSLTGIGEETQEVISENDQKKKVVHTYGWYLRQYVKDVKAKGATLIFVSPVPRNRWDKEGKFRNVMREHAMWMKQVAENEGLYFLDLNAILAKHYDELGREKVTEDYFNTGDGTHTGLAGSKRNAQAVIEGLKGLSGCKLLEYLKSDSKGHCCGSKG